MKLQRQYANGKVTHVSVDHTGTSPEQNFSTRLVAAGLADGWIGIAGDALTMKTDAEPLRYAIKRTPGYYCKSSGARIPIGEMALELVVKDGVTRYARDEALAWLVSHGKPADDYEITLAYECVLDAAQHAKYKFGG